MLLNTLDSFFQLLTLLFIFVVILALTYFTTKFIAGYQKGKGLGRNIEVIETYKITTNKYIQIIRTGEQYFAVGIGKDEIHMLTELDPGKLQLNAEKKPETLDFKDFFNREKHRRDNKKNEEE